MSVELSQDCPSLNGDGLHCRQFRVGGVSVELAGNSDDDVFLLPALNRFRVESRTSDIRIQVEWRDELMTSAGRWLFDSGSVWSLYETDGGFQFDFRTSVLGEAPYKRLVVDDKFCQGSVLLNHNSFEGRSAAVAFEYPLDELLITHRLAREKAIELHGCGIVDGHSEAGYLFVGHSGAGKSTTARLWGSQQVQILSDDRIILREHDGEIFMYGTPWHGEAAFALPERSPLQCIFILEHGKGNVLTRLSHSQAVGELFARSFVPFYRHEYLDSALSFLEQVTNRVPCYRYSFEPDQRAVERILNFRD